MNPHLGDLPLLERWRFDWIRFLDNYLVFFVPGIPQSKGSGSRVAGGVYLEAGTKNSVKSKKAWARAIADEVRRQLQEHDIEQISHAVEVTAFFRFPIPKSRRKGKKALSQGDRHAQKPDADKCLRAIYDPLKIGGLIRDDCIISDGHHYKRWCLPGEEGAHITIRF